MHKTILFLARGALCEFVFRTQISKQYLISAHLDAKTVFFLARGGCSEFVFRTQTFSNRTLIFSSPHASMHKTILFLARGELCEFVFRTNTNFLTPTHLDTLNNFSQLSTFRLEPRRLALRISIEECVGFAFPVAGGALHPLDQTSSLPR